MFCDSTLATDCSSASAMLAQERPFLGPRVPRADAFLLPGSGHNLNLMPNAQVWFAAAQSWAGRTVGPGLH